MAKGQGAPAYYVKEVTVPGTKEVRYEVSKFFDGEVQPANVYDVHFRMSGLGYCNCYAGMKKGNDDKHVKLVRLWMSESRPFKAYKV